MSDDRMIVSDELLAAFLDGNTSAEETLFVLEAARQNDDLSEIIRISSEVDEDVAEIKHAVTNLPMTEIAASQKENYLCDIECEEFVLHQFGIETTHKTLLDDAYRNCWLKEKGVPLYNIGRLLEKNNLSVSRRYGSTVEDILKLLEHGNQLIAVVDNSKLEGIDINCNEDAQNQNHAVVISSISVTDGKITLFNPYSDNELKTYGISYFLGAWEKSNNYLVVVNTTDKFIYEPYPISLEDVCLPENLIELREAIAENAHEVWAKKRKDQGWTYGPKRSDTKKETPDMVPYCNLSESEKQYDRDMAMQTLKLVQKLGFEIKRINQEK